MNRAHLLLHTATCLVNPDGIDPRNVKRKAPCQSSGRCGAENQMLQIVNEQSSSYIHFCSCQAAPRSNSCCSPGARHGSASVQPLLLVRQLLLLLSPLLPPLLPLLPPLPLLRPLPLPPICRWPLPPLLLLLLLLPTGRRLLSWLSSELLRWSPLPPRLLKAFICKALLVQLGWPAVLRCKLGCRRSRALCRPPLAGAHECLHWCCRRRHRLGRQPIGVGAWMPIMACPRCATALRPSAQRQADRCRWCHGCCCPPSSWSRTSPCGSPAYNRQQCCRLEVCWRRTAAGLPLHRPLLPPLLLQLPLDVCQPGSLRLHSLPEGFQLGSVPVHERAGAWLRLLLLPLLLLLIFPLLLLLLFPLC